MLSGETITSEFNDLYKILLFNNDSYVQRKVKFIYEPSASKRGLTMSNFVEFLLKILQISQIMLSGETITSEFTDVYTILLFNNDSYVQRKVKFVYEPSASKRGLTVSNFVEFLLKILQISQKMLSGETITSEFTDVYTILLFNNDSYVQRKVKFVYEPSASKRRLTVSNFVKFLLKILQISWTMLSGETITSEFTDVYTILLFSNDSYV